jgi:hypothetical protein
MKIYLPGIPNYFETSPIKNREPFAALDFLWPGQNESVICLTSDQYRSRSNDFSNREIRRIIASHGHITVPGRHFAIDLDCGAPQFNG